MKDSQLNFFFFIYFALEKSRQARKHITSLETINGVIIEPDEVLQEQVQFYTDMYSITSPSEEETDNYLYTLPVENVLNDDEKA